MNQMHVVRCASWIERKDKYGGDELGGGNRISSSYDNRREDPETAESGRLEANLRAEGNGP